MLEIFSYIAVYVAHAVAAVYGVGSNIEGFLFELVRRYTFTVLIALIVLAIEISGWRRWSQQAFTSTHETSKPDRVRRSFRLRVSSLLVLLGGGVYIYDCLQHPPFGSRPSIDVSTLLIALGFIVRHWENEGLAE